MPKASIIIPTHNRAKIIGETIQSVLEQTFEDFEIIIVDDGSTDDTKEVIEGFMQKDERVKYIYQENSGGTSSPRNTGAKRAQGKYLAFLDSDDLWLPEKLEKQISFFETSDDENLGFLDCKILVFLKKSKETIEYELPNDYRGNVFKKLLKNNFILTPGSILFKKEVLEEVGLFDETMQLVTDWDLWIRISKKYNFNFLNEPLFKYNIHETNITKTADLQMIANDICLFLEKYKKDYRHHLPPFCLNGLRYIANFYCNSSRAEIGRKYFVKIIEINGRCYEDYFCYLLSFLGKNFYNLCYKNLKTLKRLLKPRQETEEEKFNSFREKIFK